MGLNPYKTNIELWEEKTGKIITEDIGHKPFVIYGKEAEKHLRELFKLDYPQYQVYHNEFEILQHPEYPFLQASLDGQLKEWIMPDVFKRGVLEIKTTNILQSMQKEKWNEQIPDNYYIQCLHYLLVTGFDFCVLKAQLKSEWGEEIRITTKHYRFERSEVEADIELLKAKEIEFWTEYVLKDIKPPLLLPPI